VTKRAWGWLLRKIRTMFIAGLIVVVPIGLTVWILIWIFNGVEGLFAPLVKLIFGRPIPGVGFGVTVVLIFIVGAIAANVVGRRLVRWGESMLEKIPVARHLYVAFREVFRGFSKESTGTYLAVVLIDFPIKGMKTIGFITGENVDEDGRKLINVFVPTAPNPIGGFLEIVREEDIIRTDIPVEEALKMVVSVGSMSPKNLSGNLRNVKKIDDTTQNS
jgi:uncharacterized membrane protein